MRCNPDKLRNIKPPNQGNIGQDHCDGRLDIGATGASAEPTVSAAWVNGMVELFNELALDVPALFRDAGIHLEEVAHADTRFEPDRVSVLWEIAIARTGNPDIGLALPEIVHPATFDSIAYVMMTCPTLLTGLERFLRYMRIVSDAAEIRLQKEPGGYGITIELASKCVPVPRARIEFVVITILNICRWMTGRDMRPTAVDFTCPPPVDPSPYERACLCPLRFGAPIHQIHFSLADLTAPLPMANSELAAMHDRLAGEHLNRLDSDKASYRIRQLIIARLPDGDLLRADIAKAMCLSERTLQRRLQEEGTSFNELVDETRRALADQYLRNNDLTLAQAGYMVGFADQSAFFRASKRWFGTSPGEYRSRLSEKRMR